MKVEPIKIAYDETILECDSLDIPEGNFTIIMGESGSGKSSLLSYIYLSLNNKPQKITFNNKEFSLDNIDVRQTVRKSLISFIQQDRDFIEDLSCVDNLTLIASLSDITLTKEKVNKVLETVNLKINDNIYPNQLSGGEKCKLAFAIALIRDTPVIMCDEITAALDQESIQEIVKIIKDICMNLGKTVICTTHSKELQRSADTTYFIEDKQLKLIKSNRANCSQPVAINTSPKNKINYLKIILQRNGKEWLSNLVYIILSSFVISILVVGFQYGSQYQKAVSIIKEYSVPNEYLLTNTPVGEKNALLYSPQYFGIDPKYLDQIKNTLDARPLYPFYNFTIFGYFNNLNENDCSSFQLFINNIEQKENNPYNIKINNHPIYIFPYFNEQNYNDLCSSLDTAINGVYISNDLAAIYGFDNVQNANLKMTIGVPSYSYALEVTSMSGITSKVRNDHLTYIEIALPVKGILSPHKNHLFGTTNIYMDYHLMNEILRDNLETSIPEDAFSFYPSSYITFLNQDDNVLILAEELAKINPNFTLKSSIYLTETSSIEKIQNEQFVSKFIYASFIIFILSLFGYGIVYKKKEIEFHNKLFFYGAKKHWLFKYVIINILVYIFILFMLSSSITILAIQWLVNKGILLTIFKYKNIFINNFMLVILTSLISNIPLLSSIYKYDKNN